MVVRTYICTKEPYFSAKNPYISAQEPYISTKEPHFIISDELKSTRHTHEPQEKDIQKYHTFAGAGGGATAALGDAAAGGARAPPPKNPPNMPPPAVVNTRPKPSHASTRQHLSNLEHQKRGE